MDEASAHGWLYTASGAALPGGAAVAAGSFKLPTVATSCREKSRPGYQDLDASEYVDDRVTLTRKVRVLADLLRACRARRIAGCGGGLVIYSGAGMSTAAGVADFATCKDGVVAQAAAPRTA